jgi:hypothetical protein
VKSRKPKHRPRLGRSRRGDEQEAEASASRPLRVLILGLDPHGIPGVDADAASAGLAYGLSRFDGTGLVADQCLIPLDETAESRILVKLAGQNYDCVVIGGGIRKPEPLLELFEAVVNLIRLHAPRAAIAFNSDGGTSLEAAIRVLGHPTVEFGGQRHR